MNLTAEQLQIASMIDAKMQKLVGDGTDDLTILAEMFDYMPGFKRLMDTSEPDTIGRAVPAVCRIFFSQVRLKSPSKSVIIFHAYSGRSQLSCPPQPTSAGLLRGRSLARRRFATVAQRRP